MKRFLTLLLVVFVSLSSIAMAAKSSIKIARLPIIIQKNVLDNKTSAILETKLARASIIPQNNTLKIAEYIPPKTSQKVLGDIWQKMYAQNNKVKLSDAIKVLAEDLDADIIICPILKNYIQSTHHSSNMKTLLSTTVSAEMIVYDKTTGDLIDKKVSRRFDSDYSKFGTASYLAGECFEQLIKDTELRKILRSKKG